MFAHPRPAIISSSLPQVVRQIEQLVENEQVGEVIVGLPLSLSGMESSQAKRSRELVAALRRQLSVRVTEYDERLSSTEAERRVPKRLARSGALDSEAASIVLQSVLDARRRSGAAR